MAEEPAETPPPATALLALDLPPECVPGVIANLALLAEHFRNVESFAIPEPPQP